VGWRDDLFSLTPHYRFVVQGLIAIISILGLGYFRVVRVPLIGQVDLGVIGIVITFFWIIGMINAYNFMDGIDGMAGGVAVTASLAWMVLSFNVHNSFVFWVALAIAATSLGFLAHNWPPAKIFMGDVASTFLGYSFAVLPLLAADKSGDVLTIGTLLMWIVIMDTGMTFLRRLVNGENVLSGHRSHLFQQLVIGGYKHGSISALYIFFTFLAGLLSYEWSHGDQVAPLLILLGLPLLWILLSLHAARLPRAQ
jgi:UDP-N-acetylmuramyl pentapeptide phosphotransferase/UDP-N-acetylglucosamine-1-phosphate transferase